MPRAVNKGRRPKQSPRRQESDANSRVDSFHNSSSPACLRMTEIASYELGFGETEAVDIPNAWAALLREYILWGKPNSLVNATASKKKRKKKKKKKSGAPAAGSDTNTQGVDEDEGAVPETPPTVASGEASVPPSVETTSAAEPTKEESWESRRMQRRGEWVDRFLDEYRQQLSSQTNRSRPVEQIREDVDSFLAWLSTKGGVSDRKQRGTSEVVVPFEAAQVQQAIENIECSTCRTHVSRAFENPTVLRGCFPVDDRTASFQYHAMEEGEGKALSLHTLTLMPPKDSSAWRLQRADGSPVVWTRDILDLWLQEYVLLGGLGYDHVVVDPVSQLITDEQGDEIRDLILEFGKTALEETRQLATQLEKLAARRRSIPDSRESIDVKNAPILLELDEELTILLEKILGIVLRFMRAYQRVSVYHVRAAQNGGFEVPIMFLRFLDDDSAVRQLIGIFLDAVNAIFAKLSTMEDMFFSLAQDGQAPQLFFNAPFRSAFLEYLRKKTEILYGLLLQVTQVIDGHDHVVETVSVPYNVSLFRAVYAMDNLLKVMVPHHEQNATELEVACEDVLYLLLEWTKHLQQGMVGKIVEEHENRRQRLAGAFERADTIMMLARKGVPADNADLKGIERWYQAWKDRDVSEFRVDDLGSLSNVREMVVSKAGAMTGVAVKLGRHRAVKPETYPSRIVRMPHRFIVFTSTGNNNPENASCVDGTESRAGCVLSGLLFDWMSHKFSDWRAEIVGEELLVDLTADEGGNAWSQVARGSKKNAKKKSAANRKQPSEPGSTAVEAKIDVVAKADASSEEKASKTGKESGGLDSLEKNNKTLMGSAGEESSTVEKNSGRKQHDAETELESAPVSKKVGKTQVIDAPDKQKKEGDRRSKNSVADEKFAKEKEKPTAVVASERTTTKPSNSSKVVSRVDQSKAVPLELAKTQKEEKKVDRKQEANSQGSTAKNSMQASVPEARKNRSQASQISSAELDKMTRMGVVDRTSFQSAQDFLLSRYVEATKTPKRGKSKVVLIL